LIAARLVPSPRRGCDSDTVKLADGERVRVIGSDIRGAGTVSRAPTRRCAVLVAGKTVTPTTSSGNTIDWYGRLRRYIDVGGTDSGLRLIAEGPPIHRMTAPMATRTIRVRASTSPQTSQARTAAENSSILAIGLSPGLPSVAHHVNDHEAPTLPAAGLRPGRAADAVRPPTLRPGPGGMRHDLVARPLPGVRDADEHEVGPEPARRWEGGRPERRHQLEEWRPRRRALQFTRGDLRRRSEPASRRRRRLRRPAFHGARHFKLARRSAVQPSSGRDAHRAVQRLRRCLPGEGDMNLTPAAWHGCRFRYSRSPRVDGTLTH
jgi:hypothetical protein